MGCSANKPSEQPKQQPQQQPQQQLQQQQESYIPDFSQIQTIIIQASYKIDLLKLYKRFLIDNLSIHIRQVLLNELSQYREVQIRRALIRKINWINSATFSVDQLNDYGNEIITKNEEVTLMANDMMAAFFLFDYCINSLRNQIEFRNVELIFIHLQILIFYQLDTFQNFLDYDHEIWGQFICEKRSVIHGIQELQLKKSAKLLQINPIKNAEIKKTKNGNQELQLEKSDKLLQRKQIENQENQKTKNYTQNILQIKPIEYVENQKTKIREQLRQSEYDTEEVQLAKLLVIQFINHQNYFLKQKLSSRLVFQKRSVREALVLLRSLKVTEGLNL